MAGPFALPQWLLFSGILWLLSASFLQHSMPTLSSQAMPVGSTRTLESEYLLAHNSSITRLTPHLATARLRHAFKHHLQMDHRARSIVEDLIDTLTIPDVLAKVRLYFGVGRDFRQSVYDSHIFLSCERQATVAALKQNARRHLAVFFDFHKEKEFVLWFMEQVYQADHHSLFPSEAMIVDLPVDMLLDPDRDVDVNKYVEHAVKFNYGRWITFLHMAYHVNVDIPYEVNDDLVTPMQHILFHKRGYTFKQEEMILELLECGADVSDPDLLHRALRKGMSETVKALIEHDAPLGADVVRRLFEPRVPVEIQCDLMTLILQKPFDFERTGTIDYLLEIGNYLIVMLLYDYGYENRYNDTYDIATMGDDQIYWLDQLDAHHIPFFPASAIYAILHSNGPTLDYLFCDLHRSLEAPKYLLFAIAVQRPIAACIWFYHYIEKKHHIDLDLLRPTLPDLVLSDRLVGMHATTFTTLIRAMVKLQFHLAMPNLFAKVLGKCLSAEPRDQLPIISVLATECVPIYQFLEGDSEVFAEILEKAIRYNDMTCFLYLTQNDRSGGHSPLLSMPAVVHDLVNASQDAQVSDQFTVQIERARLAALDAANDELSGSWTSSLDTYIEVDSDGDVSMDISEATMDMGEETMAEPITPHSSPTSAFQYNLERANSITERFEGDTGCPPTSQ